MKVCNLAYLTYQYRAAYARHVRFDDHPPDLKNARDARY
jgi:hypothetical protein